MYEDQSNGYEGNGPDDHFSALSRTVCTKHAIRVARIFWQHRQRFDTKQIFVTGLQHAVSNPHNHHPPSISRWHTSVPPTNTPQGTAATALVAALAFIKDPTDRANNMQYLECLSAALSDMALTYQPAERMSVVLRAVMIELRGGGPVDNDFKLYKSKASLVPARRGSTNEAADIPLYKKRQTSRPRAGTGGSKKRSMSMISNVTNIDLTVKAPVPRFDGESDRGDGYIMVTPRSEISSWHPLDSSSAPGLEHGLTTPSTGTTHHVSTPRNAWMGAELDTSDSIAQLANVHFPEIPALTAGDGDMTHLDFLSLGDGSGDWGREWHGGSAVGVGSDLDGFPPQGGFGMGFGMVGEEWGGKMK
jgi:hypothetical protein